MCRRKSALKYYRSINGICSRSYNHCKDRVKKYKLDFDCSILQIDNGVGYKLSSL